MAVLAGQAAAAAAAASADRTAADPAWAQPPYAGAVDPAGADPAPLVDAWLVEACRVRLDGDGNVQSHLPALLAGAVSRLVAAAEAADSALPPALHRVEATRLHGCKAPGISVEAYAERLVRYCRCSPVAFVAAFSYMLRLQGGGVVAGAPRCRGRPLRVDALTAHRLMAVGTVVATKAFDDKYYTNDHYAQVAGVSLAEFNAMELDFLFRLDFRAHVAVPELAATLRHMEALACGGSSSSRLPTPVQVGCAHPSAAVPALPAAAAAAAGAGSEAAAASSCAVGATAAPAVPPAEGEDSCSDATTTTTAAAVLACGGGEEEQASAPPPPATAAAVAALLPWGPASIAAAAGAAAELAAAAEGGASGVGRASLPPRCSKKKRCSLEAVAEQGTAYGSAHQCFHHSRAYAHARAHAHHADCQTLAESACWARA